MHASLFRFAQRAALLSFATLFGMACSTSAPVPQAARLGASWSDATPTRRIKEPPPPPQASSSFINADDCEYNARAHLDSNVDEAWSQLIGCVTRRDFTYLRRLLRSPWLDVVRTKSDAALVLAKVIASRGGDVGSDLQLLRDARIPVFPFDSALTSPSVYDGRLLLVRGRVIEGRRGREGVQVHVEETIRVAHLTPYGEEQVFETRHRSSRAYRNEPQTEFAERVLDRRDRSRFNQRVDVEHKSHETGRDFIGSLRAADPFLVAGHDFVFLVRFRGAQPGIGKAEGDVHDTGLGAILAFYEASLVRID